MATRNNVSPAKRKYLGSNARIALAKRHYADYVQYVHMGRWKRARHLDLVCEKLESIMDGKTKRLMIFMPPRHGKSMTVTETCAERRAKSSPTSAAEWAEARAGALSEALRTVCTDGTARWDMSASIGVALAPQCGTDFAGLYQSADAALYQTKKRGKNGFTMNDGHGGA